MPIFDYKCPGCGRTMMDVLTRQSDQDPVCPCGETMVRQIGNVGIAFKGPGFYSNDYKKPEAHHDH